MADRAELSIRGVMCQYTGRQWHVVIVIVVMVYIVSQLTTVCSVYMQTL